MVSLISTPIALVCICYKTRRYLTRVQSTVLTSGLFVCSHTLLSISQAKARWGRETKYHSLFIFWCSEIPVRVFFVCLFFFFPTSLSLRKQNQHYPLGPLVCAHACVYWATSYKLSLANFSRGESYRSLRTSQLLHSAVFFASHRFWKEKFVPHVYKAIWKQNKTHCYMALLRTPPFSFPLPVPYHHFEQPNKLPVFVARHHQHSPVPILDQQ